VHGSFILGGVPQEMDAFSHGQCSVRYFEINIDNKAAFRYLDGYWFC
jgi:hypothetical protein